MHCVVFCIFCEMATFLLHITGKMILNVQKPLIYIKPFNEETVGLLKKGPQAMRMMETHVVAAWTQCNYCQPGLLGTKILNYDTQLNISVFL